MKKILCSLILVLTMLINVSSAFAYEYAPYVGDGILKATSVKLTDENGDVVTSLTGGEKVTASVRIKAGTESLTGSEKVSLILASYSEGFLEEVDIDTKTVSGAGDFTATVTVPVVEPGIRVFLWDEIDGGINARPLFSMGEIPAESKGIEQISIGGALIENFSADVYEYDVTVNAGYTSWPEIVVYTGNTASNVNAQYEGVFPLSTLNKQVIDADGTPTGTSKVAVATIIAGDKVYKINVTQELPEITDVRFTYNNKKTGVDESWPEVKNIDVQISYNIQNPTWTSEFPGPNVESPTGMSEDRMNEYFEYLKDSELSNSTRAYPNYNFRYFFDLAPMLVGSQCILPERLGTSTGPTTAKETNDYMTFTINRSARIYAYVGSSSSALNKNDGWVEPANEIYVSSKKAVRGIFARTMGSSTNAYSTYVVAPMKYLDVKVNPGETQTVTIPKGNAIGYTFIKFNESSTLASNPSFKYGDTVVNTLVMELHKPVLRDNFAEGDDRYKIYTSAQPETSLSTSDKPYEATGNVIYASSMITNAAGYVPVTYDERFEGAQFIRLRGKMPELQYIKFDLSGPAKIYILTNLTSEEDFTKFKACLDGYKVMGYGEEKLITFYNTANGKEISYVLPEKTSLEKEYYMDSGETQTITLDFSSMSFPDNKIVSILVQPLN